MKFFNDLNFIRCKRKWRKLNQNNFTSIGKKIFDMSKVHIGSGTYGELNVIQFEKTCPELWIGSYCSIAPEVTFIMDGEHEYTNISTYPFKSRFLHLCDETMSKGNIILEDDVWIGYGATILSGSHIGQGAVIAAGAVVVGDVPSYAIVGGVPAKVIKYRFKQEIIQELLKIDFGSIHEQYVRDNINLFYSEIDSVNQLDNLPKKGE